MDGLTVMLMFMILICGCTYLVLVPILAAEFGHRNVRSYQYGYMVCAYALSATVMSFLVSWFMFKFGRSRVLYTGLVIMAVSMCSTGTINYVKNNSLMIMFGVFCRLLQGMAKSFIFTSSVSMIIILNPNDQVKFVGLVEGVYGFGSIGGPILGSILYSFFGFLSMFLIVGFIHLIFIPLLISKMPIQIDKNDDSTLSLAENQDRFAEEETKAAQQSEFLSKSNSQAEQILIKQVNEEQAISYYQLFKDPLIILPSIAQFIMGMAFCYIEPLLSFRLQEFTDSVRLQGLIFSFLTIGYCIMSFVVPYLAKFINLTTLVFLGLFFCGASNFLIGPSELLPNNVVLVSVGLLLLGLSCPCIFVPYLPIMLKRCESRFPSQNRKATDLCSGIYSGTFCFGQLLGPIFGGYLNDMLGFRRLCDLTGVLIVLYSILYILLSLYFIKSQKPRENILSKTFYSESNYQLKPKVLASNAQHGEGEI